MPIAPEYLHLIHAGPFPAILYGRNSRDPKKKGRSVGSQLSEGRSLCQNNNWPIVDEFKDTGISASRHAKKKRDDFEALLTAIESRKGNCRIVVAFEASRYYRDLEAYVRLRNACHDAGVFLCYNGQVYDLSKREDRKATARDALDAEDEGEGIRDRNLRTVRLNAEAGGPHGKIPFGYARRYDPDTGDLIEQYPHPVRGPFAEGAFQRFDSGQSVYTITRWLRSEEKAARPDGVPWREDSVKYMLRNPAYVGDRVHQGRVVRKATWEPILKGSQGRALFQRVSSRLLDPDRSVPWDNRARHLLSVIALCGPCGDRAFLTAVKSSRGRFEYKCATAYDTLIGERELDACVEEAVLKWVGSPEARAALIPDEGKVAEKVAAAEVRIANLTAQLEEARSLSTQFTEDGRPQLTVASLGAMERELLPMIEAARSEIEASSGVPQLIQQLLSAADPASLWSGVPASEEQPGQPGLTLEQQRAVIRRIVTVRLWKAGKGTRRILPGRISLSFVGEPGYVESRASAHALAGLHAPLAGESQ